MYQILTLNKISATGLDRLPAEQYTHGNEIAQPDAIMVRSASMHEMELDQKTVAIARAGAGVNNIPVDACSEQGIVVFNTPGANANAVKELVLCALLLTSRKIVPAIDWCKTLKGEGDAVGKLVEKGKSAFTGPEIKGKTLGVVGLGAIGILVANAAKSLGMQVYGYDPYLSVDAAWSLSSDIKHATSLVNSKDILEALQNGKVAAYATDFPSDELIGESGVIAIPHLGASTPESEDNCAAMAADELKDYLEEGVIRNSVNLPNVVLPRSADTRICLIHKNVPSMLNQITATLTEKNVNIDNMINKSKKAFAYTVIDTNDAIGDDTLAALSAIEGIVRVRVIR